MNAGIAETLLAELITEMEDVLKTAKANITNKKGRNGKTMGVPSDAAKKIGEKMMAFQKLLYLFSESEGADKRALLRCLSEPDDKDLCIDIFTDSNSYALIRMPYLPNRSKQYDVIFDLLATKLLKAGSLPQWSASTISFVHTYPTNMKVIPKDNDNYAYKRAIDLIAYATGCSDCPLTLDISMRTVFTDILAPGTYIEIKPKSSDFDFIKKWDTIMAGDQMR